MSEIPVQITDFLDHIFKYGSFWVYLILFAACFIENLFPPFPGDSFIIAAGGLVALQRLDFLLTVFLILSGGMFSVMLLFHMGGSYGREYFEKKNFKYFSVKDINTMEVKLEKWGALILMASRFLVGIRAAVAIAAGVARYPATKMVFYSTVSYVIFTITIIMITISTVENLDVIKSYLTKYNLIAWPIIILVILLYFFRKYLFFKRESQ
jgi:membrane protein DedA with SNARE-associated domain